MEGDLRVWWIPQIPMNPFYWTAKSVQQAQDICRLLAEYDKFQFDNNVKPDYCNAGGLQVFEDGEWCDWWSEDGEEFDF